MERKFENIEQEINENKERIKKIEQLRQLLSTYNAYKILLMQTMCEYKRKKAPHYSISGCYQNFESDLFSLFENNECLKAKRIDISSRIEDKIFLIDDSTLLILNSYINSVSYDQLIINYEILKINDCTIKIFKGDVPHIDSDYDEYFKKEDVLGLFYKGNLIAPSYKLEEQFKSYDNMDIREILIPQSLEEIYGKITESKDISVKKLSLF